MLVCAMCVVSSFGSLYVWIFSTGGFRQLFRGLVAKECYKKYFPLAVIAEAESTFLELLAKHGNDLQAELSINKGRAYKSKWWAKLFRLGHRCRR